MLKIPDYTGSHSVVWPHTDTAHIDKLGSAALAAVVPYPGEATRLSPQGTRKYD